MSDQKSEIQPVWTCPAIGPTMKGTSVRTSRTSAGGPRNAGFDGGRAFMRQLAKTSTPSVTNADARTPHANPTELLKRLLSMMG